MYPTKKSWRENLASSSGLTTTIKTPEVIETFLSVGVISVFIVCVIFIFIFSNIFNGIKEFFSPQKF